MVIASEIMEPVEDDEMLSEESEDENGEMTDSQLQKAFAKGLLKPGMNLVLDRPKHFANDVVAMKDCLADLKKDLPWLERLDLTNPPAEDVLAKIGGKLESESNGEVNADDDFQREMYFYRQAQATVLEALPVLKKNCISTKRPNDYFAEMAKSDQQMQKIRKKLLSKQAIMERSEKAKKLREQRKFGKKVQVEVIQKRQKEKKAMMNAVKKYQKGMTDKLDFLEGDQKERNTPAKGASQKSKNNKGPNARRKYKDQKFGFGGKKSGRKWNTKESHNDVSSFRSSMANAKGPKGKKGKGGKQNKRPGKSVRRKMKSRS